MTFFKNLLFFLFWVKYCFVEAIEHSSADIVIFFNWDSLHARLNSHYEAWSYKKKAQKRLQDTENQFRKNLNIVKKDVC